MSDPKALAIRALELLKGDNFARASFAFRGMSPEQMKEQYGYSGKTRAEMLAEYEKHETDVTAAIDWVQSK